MLAYSFVFSLFQELVAGDEWNNTVRIGAHTKAAYQICEEGKREFSFNNA